MNIKEVTYTLTAELRRKLYLMILDELGEDVSNIDGYKFTYKKYFTFSLVPSNSYLSYRISQSIFIEGVQVPTHTIKGYMSTQFQTTDRLKKALDKIVKLNLTDLMVLRDKLKVDDNKTLKNSNIF